MSYTKIGPGIYYVADESRSIVGTVKRLHDDTWGYQTGGMPENKWRGSYAKRDEAGRALCILS